MNKINVNINVDNVDMKSLFNADAIEMNKNLNLSNNSSVTTNQNLNTPLTETLDISAVNKETETLSLTNNQANNPQVSNFSPNSYSDKDNIYINKLSDIMTAMQANNTTVAKREINNMLNNLDEVYSDKLWGIDFVNQIIKDQFIEELRKSLIEIVE